jgi:cysteine desulfurase
MRTVYLDNNATTAIAPEVREAMEAYFTAEYFNPSSAYERASPAAQAIKRARETVARFLGGVEPSEILFTSCATESLNAALYGAVRANPARRHVVTTTVEHPAVDEVCKDLARGGMDVTFLPVDRAGNLDLRAFIQALRPDTLIVAVMHANNETGVIFPVEQWRASPRRPTPPSSS